MENYAAESSIPLNKALKDVSSCDVFVSIAAYPEHGLEGDDLLRAADEALYQAKAKAKGKNQATLAVNKPRDDREHIVVN
jgi:GGDEF domain-containing protein